MGRQIFLHSWIEPLNFSFFINQVDKLYVLQNLFVNF